MNDEVTDSPERLLRRYLAQRPGMGEPELMLEAMRIEQVRAALAAGGVDIAAARALAAAGAVPAAPRAPEPTPASVPAPEPRRAPIVRPAPAAAAPAGRWPDLPLLREDALGCTLCALSTTRTHVVFGEGDPNARLAIVGEAPGAEEDRSGRPFVGRAGKLLDTLLASIGFSRESVYICNVLKCRPPGNRNPEPEEVEACSPFLRRQLELVAPSAILALGAFAAQTLLGTTTAIGKLRGTVHRYEGIPLVPTYHPAALLRNPVWIRPAWDDLQQLRSVLDRA